jgi:nucleoside-diphosphate-sugar epimerase
MTDVLLTGAAGFIGFHVAQRLMADGHRVLGLDNLNDYYDPTLKQARLDRLMPNAAFTFERLDVSDREAMSELFRRHRPARVVHLAAQAGVRYSIQNPHAYVEANLVGFMKSSRAATISGALSRVVQLRLRCEHAPCSPSTTTWITSDSTRRPRRPTS